MPWLGTAARSFVCDRVAAGDRRGGARASRRDVDEPLRQHRAVLGEARAARGARAHALEQAPAQDESPLPEAEAPVEEGRLDREGGCMAAVGQRRPEHSMPGAQPEVERRSEGRPSGLGVSTECLVVDCLGCIYMHAQSRRVEHPSGHDRRQLRSQTLTAAGRTRSAVVGENHSGKEKHEDAPQGNTHTQHWDTLAALAI